MPERILIQKIKRAREDFEQLSEHIKLIYGGKDNITAERIAEYIELLIEAAEVIEELERELESLKKQ
jgi:hypothetical protein